MSRVLHARASGSETVPGIAATPCEHEVQGQRCGRSGCRDWKRRITQIAEALGVKLSYFFADGVSGKANARSLDSLDLGEIREGQRLLSAFKRIDDPQTRRRTIELLVSLVTKSK
jgi:hypothetical protein